MAQNVKIQEKELEAKIEQYLTLKNTLDTIAKEADKLKEELKKIAELNPAETVTAGVHSITITHATRETINAKEFKEAHPRLAAKFTKVTPYSTVKIK